MSRTSMRFTAEVLKKTRLAFPCFNASHAAWETHFRNRIDPYRKNDILRGGEVAVVAEACKLFQHVMNYVVAVVISTFLSPPLFA